MDPIDSKIVEVIQNNADLTNTELAAQVNLSPSSCLRRVQRLRKEGVILKTVGLVDPDKLNRGLTAIVDVTLERHGTEARLMFMNQILKEPAISQVYSVTGETDVILIINLVDMKEYQAICNRLFNNDPNVVKFRTLFAMERNNSKQRYRFPPCRFSNQQPTQQLHFPPEKEAPPRICAESLLLSFSIPGFSFIKQLTYSAIC